MENRTRRKMKWGSHTRAAKSPPWQPQYPFANAKDPRSIPLAHDPPRSALATRRKLSEIVELRRMWWLEKLEQNFGRSALGCIDVDHSDHTLILNGKENNCGWHTKKNLNTYI